MFAEEEWTDAAPADEQAHAVVKPGRLAGKQKTISRHCLKRTLQTLGTVPNWECIKPAEGSHGETEKTPVNISMKNKRCKKRKKTSDLRAEGDTGREADALEKPVKKRLAKRKPDKAETERSPKTLCKAVKDGRVNEKSSSCTEDSTEKSLNRRKWRNKMKNKRRCMNKFLQNSAGVANRKLKEETLGQIQGLSVADKVQNDGLSLGRMVSGERRDVVAMSTDTSENVKAVTDKVNNGTHQLKPRKPVCKGPKTNPHNRCEKQKPVKMDKSSQLQAKKLQHILNVHATDSDKKVVQENEDLKKETNEDGKSQMDRSSALRSRMEKRLESARFRYINELLYTSTSGEAKRMFKQDPNTIRIYHKGYTEQVKHWPANPVDSIISYIRKKSSSLVIADFGCGDCKIAQSVKNKVHCFDMAPVSDLVTACDMANVPLGDSTVNIAVFCLSLMGTNLTDFLAEANRVLVMGGVLKIAEVASRFDNIRQFTGALSRLGFKLVNKDTDNTHFYSFEFLKTQNAPDDVRKTGLELKPCLYKKR